MSLTAGDLTGQAIAAGLVDELSVSLVPVVFGSGVRFFGEYTGDPARSAIRVSSREPGSPTCSTASESPAHAR